jgi:hypothetical protein
MTDFQINDEDLTGFKGKVAVVTGKASHGNTASGFTADV